MATILDLLMALNRGDLPPIPGPAPAVPLTPPFNGGPPPVPEYTPSQVVEPPQAPLDTRILAQILASGGSAPTPPAPLSRGQRIANALIGFGAGVGGYGPQYLAQLQEPQRRYEAQLQDYNANQQRLKLAGTETMLRSQEQKTRRAQEVSDREFQQEFARESRRLRLYDDESKMRLQQAFTLERDAKQAREETARELERERRQKETQARAFEYDLVKKDHAPPEVAQDISQYMAGIRPAVSAATRKWQEQQAKKLQLEQDRLQASIARLNSIGTGGGGTGKPMAILEDGSQVPISKVDTKNGRAMINGKPKKVVRYTGGGASAPQQTTTQGQKADPLGIR